MSTIHHRGKQDAIPQQGMRTLRGGNVASLPCGQSSTLLNPRAYRHFGRDSHGIARTFESLRRLRLSLVSCPG